MNWLYELVLGRATNESNVVLVETNDEKRRQTLYNALEDLTLIDMLYKDYLDAGVINRESVEQYILNLKILRLFKFEKRFLNGVRYNIPKLVNTPNPYLYLHERFTENTYRRDEMKNLEIMRSGIVLIDAVKDERFVDRMLLGFLYEWSQNGIFYINRSYIVVLTSNLGYFPESLRQICVTVSVPPSTREERESLINELVSRWGAKHKKKVRIPSEVYNITSGLNLHDVETAILKSLKLKGRIDLAFINDYKRNVLRQMGYEYVITNRGFESVGGYDYMKEYFKRRIISILKNPKRAEKYHVALPRGILLVGPPGTGKTWLVKALSTEAKIPMISVSASTFLSKYVGETERAVRRFLKIVDSMSPLIVFMDEIDALFMSRESMSLGDSGTTLRMTNELLAAIGDENRRWLLIGATNRPEAMDWASMRAGRIDEILFVGYPDFEARKAIFRVHTRVLYRDVEVSEDVDYDELARLTEWFSSSEIATICNEARFEAFYNNTPVKMEYFLKIIERKKNDVSIASRKEKTRRMVETLRRIEFINRELLDMATSGLNIQAVGKVERVETI